MTDVPAQDVASNGENELIRRAQLGSVDAFESLYWSHARRVYSLCLRMTANTSDAEDLMQEVFVRIWQKIGSFRGESAFSTWLQRITINMVLNERRSSARRAEHVIFARDLRPYERPNGAQTRPGTRTDLEHAIALLPRKMRDVFILHDVRGLTHREISAELRIPIGTAKAELHRARRRLREVLR